MIENGPTVQIICRKRRGPHLGVSHHPARVAFFLKSRPAVTVSLLGFYLHVFSDSLAPARHARVSLIIAVTFDGAPPSGYRCLFYPADIYRQYNMLCSRGSTTQVLAHTSVSYWNGIDTCATYVARYLSLA